MLRPLCLALCLAHAGAAADPSPSTAPRLLFGPTANLKNVADQLVGLVEAPGTWATVRSRVEASGGALHIARPVPVATRLVEVWQGAECFIQDPNVIVCHGLRRALWGRVVGERVGQCRWSASIRTQNTQRA